MANLVTSSQQSNANLLKSESYVKQLAISANENDFYVTINWILNQHQKRNGIFNLPEGKLYPFLHLEDTYKSGSNILIKKCFDKLTGYKTAYEAMQNIREWIGGFPLRMVGSGSNHIYFQVLPKSENDLRPSDRIAIIYFDPYEL